MKKILIVEDDELTRLSLEFRLRLVGHEVITANNGKEAIEIVKKELPDIIITDILMPEKSGLELVNFVRKDHIRPYIAIVVLTAIRLDPSVFKEHHIEIDDIF